MMKAFDLITKTNPGQSFFLKSTFSLYLWKSYCKTNLNILDMIKAFGLIKTKKTYPDPSLFLTGIVLLPDPTPTYRSETLAIISLLVRRIPRGVGGGSRRLQQGHRGAPRHRQLLRPASSLKKRRPLLPAINPSFL